VSVGRRRRKSDNSFEVAKLVGLLIFLAAFALAGGNLKAALGLFLPLVFGLLGLVVVGFVGVLVWKLMSASRPPKSTPSAGWVPPSSQRSLPARATPEEEFSHEPVATKLVPAALESFSRALLDQLEWRRFEMLVEGLFQAEGRVPSRLRAGADGGIDLVLQDVPDGPVVAIVQCKAWKTYSVGVKPVRELFGVMAAEGTPQGFFVTSGSFTSEAREFAKFKPLELIDGPGLLGRLNRLEDSARTALLRSVTAGDYTTPTCPSCDTKMARRTSRHGEFWGCRSFPRCRQTFHIGAT